MSNNDGSIAPVSNENRWWEFYIIRYSMGTVIGAIIVYSLLKSSSHSDLLLLPAIDKLKYYHFIFLAFYGLTYSYIASAPILVFHASRFAFSYSGENRIFKIRWYAYALSFFSVLILISFMFPNIMQYDYIFVLLLAVFVILPQWILIIYSGLKINDNYKFYVDLSERRRSSKTDFRESYKHLREHGNSFSILFFEIVLGISLYYIGVKNISLFLGFLILWILPAVYVWFIGTGLENRFANNI